MDIKRDREGEGFGLTYKGFNLCSSYVNGLYVFGKLKFYFNKKKTAVNQFKPLKATKKSGTEPIDPKHVNISGILSSKH